MKRFDSYLEAEKWLQKEICYNYDWVTDSTYEIIGIGFTLTNPTNNMNDHSNYEYAGKFFIWLMSGEKTISKDLLDLNPWVERFASTTNLPESFSATYGWKIKEQLQTIIEELERDKFSRRSYLNILIPEDKIILGKKTTHEFPCTIGFQLFLRSNKLHMIVNMRSNNCYSVLPYDVFNFTSLQSVCAKMLKVDLGEYHHFMNSAHIFNGDRRRLLTILK